MSKLFSIFIIALHFHFYKTKYEIYYQNQSRILCETDGIRRLKRRDTAFTAIFRPCFMCGFFSFAAYRKAFQRPACCGKKSPAGLQANTHRLKGRRHSRKNSRPLSCRRGGIICPAMCFFFAEMPIHSA